MSYVGGQALVDHLFALADPSLTRAQRRDRITAIENTYAPMTLRDLIPLSTMLVQMGNHDCLSSILKFWTGDSRHGNYPIEHPEHPTNGSV